MLNNMWNTQAAIEEHIRQSTPPEFPEMLANIFLNNNHNGLRVLHLTLKKHWYDMIDSGEKLEEYREVKPYWIARLSKQYDAVLFRNGYSQNARKMLWQIRDIRIKNGHIKWGAPEHESVFVIALGMRMKING